MNRLPPADIARLNKELSELGPVVEALAQLDARREELAGLEALAADPGEDADLRRLAAEERAALAAALPALEQGLLLALLPRDGNDERGVILEVGGTGAAGGGRQACPHAHACAPAPAAASAAGACWHGWRRGLPLCSGALSHVRALRSLQGLEV